MRIRKALTSLMSTFGSLGPSTPSRNDEIYDKWADTGLTSRQQYSYLHPPPRVDDPAKRYITLPQTFDFQFDDRTHTSQHHTSVPDWEDPERDMSWVKPGQISVSQALSGLGSNVGPWYRPPVTGTDPSDCSVWDTKAQAYTTIPTPEKDSIIKLETDACGFVTNLNEYKEYVRDQERIANGGFDFNSWHRDASKAIAQQQKAEEAIRQSI